MKKIIQLTIVVELFCLVNGLAFGATLNVPEDYPTIQAAIENACDGDTVVIDEEIYMDEGSNKLELGSKNISIELRDSAFNYMDFGTNRPASSSNIRKAENPMESGFMSTTSKGETYFLFNGSEYPEDHGWLSYSNGYSGGPNRPPPIIITQSGGSESDVFYASTSEMTFNEYMIDSGAGTFYLSIRVAIEEASHNLHDAGFAFSPIGRSYPINGEGGNNFVWTDRHYGLYINSSQIGFQDEFDLYYLNTTTFHEYAILYTHDLIKVYVDTTYEDILNGSAVPILLREISAIHPQRIIEWTNLLDGAIVFGDTTNDNGINSSYTLDYVKFEYLGPRVYPRQGSSDSIIWITGKNFGQHEGKVYLANKKCHVIDWDEEVIQCSLKHISGLDEGTYNITIMPRKMDPILMKNCFTFMGPVVQSWPVYGFSGDHVTITGYFIGERNLVNLRVYLGDLKCRVISWAQNPNQLIERHIVFEIPKNIIPGVYDLTVSNEFGSDFTNNFYVNMYPPW
jgi:hypothetical protein